MSGSGESTTLATRGLDLAARVLDLTSVLSQTSNLAGGLYELGQWLALERVDRNELYDCFQKARGLVYANQSGQDFYNEIALAKPVNNAWPLIVQQSGSLGRLIIKDPHLAWIVSTTACLFQFHNDRFISEAVCMIIMLSDPNNENRPDSELRYLSSRVELKAVVDRIISSIWFNVLNSGTSTEKLPAELEAVCTRGHHLNGDKFGIVVHALKQPLEKVVLESEHLLKNLTLWLLIHFQGTLIISTSGKVLFERILGESSRVVELKVKKFCDENHDCSNEEDTYRLFRDIKGSYEEFLSGTYPSSFDMPETTMARRSLYDIMRAYDIGTQVLSDAVKAEIRQCAQDMVKWLISLPLTTPEDADFGFSVISLDTNINTISIDSFTIGTIFSRSPSILNFKYGTPAKEKVVYGPWKPDNDPEKLDNDHFDSEDEDQGDWADDALNRASRDIGPEATFNEDDIVKSFPVLKDLASMARRDCQCYYCMLSRQKDIEGDFYSLPPGCKSHAAISAVFLFISHAIADGFGATDASGTRNPEPPMKAIVTVFAEILQRQQVRWDSWFSVAACVFLGCPFRDRVMDIELGGTAFAAIQYGNLSVVAPWLDLTKKQEVKHCFRFIMTQGKLGVMRDSSGKKQFRGIPEQFAIIQAEHTEDTSNFSDSFEKWSEPLTGSIAIKEDDCSFVGEVTLVTADEDVYRLWIRIRSDSFVRIIDPVDSMIRLARSLPYVECEHKENGSRIEHPQDTIKLYSFDELLGRWQTEETFYGVNKVGPPTLFHGSKTEDDTPGLIFHMTSVLHHDGMINVARALSVNYMTVVNQGNCCLPCVIQKAKTMPLPKNSEDLDVRDRYIINVKSNQSQVVRQQKRSHANMTGNYI